MERPGDHDPNERPDPVRRLAPVVILLILFTACGTAEAQPVRTTPPKVQVRRPGDPCNIGDGPCWRRWIRDRDAWNAELRRQEHYARLLAFAAAVDKAKRAEAARRNLGGYPAPYPIGGGLLMGSGRCGPSYGLPPCKRLGTESRGIINIYYGGKPYRTHSCCSASGKWAFIDRTWARHRGYPTAASAPEWVQDEKARQIWAGGRGCFHWSAC